MAETPDAERLLNEDEPAGPGSVVDRLRTRAEAFETRPAMHDGFTYTADDAKLDRDAIAALRAPASPPVQDAGELVGRLRAGVGQRPCDCDRCHCGNVGDAESVARWDEDNAGMALRKEAAAEIERLTGDPAEEAKRRAIVDGLMDGMKVVISQLEARVTKAEADLAEARAALEPFVRHWEDWMHNRPDEVETSSFARHTFGELRRARAALSRLTPEPQPEASPVKKMVELTEALGLAQEKTDG